MKETYRDEILSLIGLKSFSDIATDLINNHSLDPKQHRNLRRIVSEIADGDEWKNRTETFTNHQTGKKTSHVTVDFLPLDEQGIASVHKINLETHVITLTWSKLQPDGKFVHSVQYKPKKIEDITPLDLLKTLESYTPGFISSKPQINDKLTRPSCAFIDITDYHIDQRDIHETPIEQRIEEFFTLLKGMVYKAYASHQLEEIVFVIGSDFLHTDTFQGTTTNGTPQETTVRWNQAFDIAFQMYADSIMLLKDYCKSLKVILVSGNHGRTKEYYLAHGLQRYFEKDTTIEFDIEPIPRKIYTYGSTFIGLHHGDAKVNPEFVLSFAKEFRREWGVADYHEIKVGDKHTHMEKDIQGVLVKQIPAMVKADTWHRSQNYINGEKFAVCTIYDKEKGRCNEIFEKL